MLRQLAQTGVITEPEVLYDFGDWDEDHESDHMRLPNAVRYFLAAANEPFRILVMLLTGMHSANFRTNKGSIYRIRFVAPGEPNSASTPATKAPAAAAAASKTSKMVTKSAAYPLVLVCNDYFPEKWSDSSDQTEQELDEEFRQLIEEEMRAVDALDTSDSSSATDTNWMYAYKYRPYHRPPKGGVAVNYTCRNFCEQHYGEPLDDPRAWVHDPNNDSPPASEEDPRVMYLQQNVPSHLKDF